MDYLRILWEQFSSFCSCLSCTEDINNSGFEPSERTHLLADPTNNSPAIRRTNSDNLSHEISQSLPKKDDQNALCRLVQNTAINMIDVGAMDSHNLEHQEYNDRIKIYSQRLQQQWSNIQHPNKQQMIGLLKDVPSADFQLQKLPINDDVTQMRNALNKAHAAINDIRIEHKEEIVVPFQIL